MGTQAEAYTITVQPPLRTGWFRGPWPWPWLGAAAIRTSESEPEPISREVIRRQWVIIVHQRTLVGGKRQAGGERPVPRTMVVPGSRTVGCVPGRADRTARSSPFGDGRRRRDGPMLRRCVPPSCNRTSRTESCATLIRRDCPGSRYRGSREMAQQGRTVPVSALVRSGCGACATTVSDRAVARSARAAGHRRPCIHRDRLGSPAATPAAIARRAEPRAILPSRGRSAGATVSLYTGLFGRVALNHLLIQHYLRNRRPAGASPLPSSRINISLRTGAPSFRGGRPVLK